VCSIGGWISKKPLEKNVARRITTALLFYGQERGIQSGGVLIDGKLLKKAIEPYDLSQTQEYFDLFKSPVSSALVHTRQPTSGGKGDDQAQPFVINDVASIHNGWFINIQELKRRWNIQKTSGVDSELVTAFVHSYGINALPKFLRSASGSSAFAFMYKGELYLMRSGNPTAYTIIDTEDENTIFVFSSTPKILNNAIRWTWLLPPGHPIKETKEGILFHVTPENVVKKSQKTHHKNDFITGGSRIWTAKSIEEYYDRKFFYEGDDCTDDISYFKPREERYDSYQRTLKINPESEGIDTD
jgi:glutamine phosphoribosylpyrophosphate amidotransferase